VLYTDGVTEAFNNAEEEFGENRLIEALARSRELPAQELASAVAREVLEFSAHKQYDDITLIAAKARQR
jgi:sigma-B regulation protein RsbU (phosphoserine phosphatase)